MNDTKNLSGRSWHSPHPFALSLSKGLFGIKQGFDKLSPNGSEWYSEFRPILSLSKDKLRANGVVDVSRNKSHP